MAYIYKNLKEFRLDRGMSQAELARKLRMSPSYISGVEVGSNKPGSHLKEAIDDYFPGYYIKGINAGERRGRSFKVEWEVKTPGEKPRKFSTEQGAMNHIAKAALKNSIGYYLEEVEL